MKWQLSLMVDELDLPMFQSDQIEIDHHNHRARMIIMSPILEQQQKIKINEMNPQVIEKKQSIELFMK
ncbi:hypothetical protein DERP_000311 [Dermatophagoides pteronyssinus]|uniref:Uncharacterized protein n=1 Tax=Dermatophagoides pteronyssinus TaxID=6956 RepID=A0ABQ8IZW0_DERPT|nr:hypothetical protein DERP_000311 [Dermatophagoides pteronyssinus]